MNARVTLGAVSVALFLWAAESIALESKRPPSLPALDLNCYKSYGLAFGTLEAPTGELGIDGDNYEKPRYRFRTIGDSILKVIEFPDESGSMRKEYGKTISELSFDLSGRDYIFAWRDNEEMGPRVFAVNQRDRLVAVLERPGILRVLKCKDTIEAAPPPHSQGVVSRSVRPNGAGVISEPAIEQTASAKAPNRLPGRTQGSVSSHSRTPALVLKAPPMYRQAGR